MATAPVDKLPTV